MGEKKYFTCQTYILSANLQHNYTQYQSTEERLAATPHCNIISHKREMKCYHKQLQFTWRSLPDFVWFWRQALYSVTPSPSEAAVWTRTASGKELRDKWSEERHTSSQVDHRRLDFSDCDSVVAVTKTHTSAPYNNLNILTQLKDVDDVDHSVIVNGKNLDMASEHGNGKRTQLADIHRNLVKNLSMMYVSSK